MTLRTQSQLGWGLLEWMGRTAAYEGEANRPRDAELAERIDAACWQGRRSGMGETMFTMDEMQHWPNAEALIAGEPPMPSEEYQRAVLNAGVETGVVITRVDPETGTVTVSGCAPPGPFGRGLLGERLCACSRVVPESEWVEPHGCCDDCYWALPDSREARFQLQCEDDRERIVDEARD